MENYVFWKLYTYTQSVCLLKDAKREEPIHGNVRVRLREETKMSSSGRCTSRLVSGNFPGICMPPIHIIILYIPGECAHGG